MISEIENGDGAAVSLKVATDTVESIVEAAQEEIYLKVLFENMPSYNVETAIQMAFLVNDYAIKSYDVKKDDNAFGSVVATASVQRGGQRPLKSMDDPFFS